MKNDGIVLKNLKKRTYFCKKTTVFCKLYKKSLSWYRCTLLSLMLVFTLCCTALAQKENIVVSEKEPVNAWPLLYMQDSPDEQLQTGEWLWPFIFNKRLDAYDTAWGFRPLFCVRDTDTASGPVKRRQVLWPIFEHRTSPEGKQTQLIPLYFYRSKNTDEKLSGTRKQISDRYAKKIFIVFPLILGGTKQQEDYLAVFPFGGRLVGWLSADEIKFVLWPLYTWARKEEQESVVILWPFYSRTHSPVVDAWRLWPLAGHSTKDGEYEKLFLLWPFFNYQRLGLSDEEPGHAVMVFPFYAQKKKKDYQAKSVLWPLYGFSHNERIQQKQWNAPWPIVTIVESPKKHTRWFWPLAGWQKTDKRSSAFYLWPVFTAKQYDTKIQAESRRNVFPFYSGRRSFFKDKDVRRHRVKFWPLFYYDRVRPGACRFYMISPLWFEQDKNVLANYAPFWHIWDYERDKDGNVRSGLIARLFTYRRRGREKHMDLVHMFAYSRSDQSKKISFLKGFLEYERTEEHKMWRFLYFLKFKTAQDHDTKQI